MWVMIVWMDIFFLHLLYFGVIFLSFSSLPLQTCLVQAGGHPVLPGECTVSVLCFLNAVCLCVCLSGSTFFTVGQEFVWEWACILLRVTVGKRVTQHYTASLSLGLYNCSTTRFLKRTLDISITRDCHSFYLGRYSSSSSSASYSPTFQKQVSKTCCNNLVGFLTNPFPYFLYHTCPMFFLIKPVSYFQRNQQRKTYQMPCLRKAASQSRLSTSLTMMKDPTQVFWTVETVPGMCHVVACVQK